MSKSLRMFSSLMTVAQGLLEADSIWLKNPRRPVRKKDGTVSYCSRECQWMQFFSMSKGLFILDPPTAKRRRRHCIHMIKQRVRCECFDCFTRVPKPTRRVLRRQIVADVSSLNTP